MNINELKPLEKNPFKAKDPELIKLKKSIQKFPKMMSIRKIVIDENNIIWGGNKRYFACKMLGFNEIPDEWIDKRTDLTEEEKKRFAIADNIGFGEWDLEILEEWDVPFEEWGVELPEMESEPEILDYSDKNKEIDTNDYSDKMTLKFELTSEEYQFIQSELSKINASKEIALLKLMNYEPQI
jgi:hypothetical protein